MNKKTPVKIKKEKRQMMCFRIDKDLRRRMKSYVALNGFIVQDWLEEIIEKNIKG